ncbi:MAG TPA: hypothetical protein VJT09_06885 [Pyrinomonadaceae bacterium]|nr:hypothetical protein [Pyrinomonadaceae bacterium]
MRAVRKIVDFNGVSRGTAAAPGEADKLKQKGVKTIDDLWRCVGVNFDKGIDTVATETAVDRELVYALLIADGLGDSRHRVEAKPWLNPVRWWIALKRLWYGRERHWLEASLAIATILLVMLAIRARYLGPKMAQQVVVAPSARLLPFKSITDKNVILKSIPEEKGAFTAVEKVVGRYPRREVGQGTTVLEEQLVAEDLTGAMRERRVLTLPVNPGSLSSTLTTSARVWLLLSPRAAAEKAPPPVVLKDVILLSVNKQAGAASVEVAVTEDGLKVMEPLLGGSEIFVFQPAE